MITTELFKSDILRQSKHYLSERNFIYFLIDSDKKEIVYVGFSTNYISRIEQHYLDKKIFDKYFVINCSTQSHGLVLEKKYIEKFQPIYNTKDKEEILIPKVALLRNSMFMLRKNMDLDYLKFKCNCNPIPFVLSEFDFLASEKQFTTKTVDGIKYLVTKIKNKKYHAKYEPDFYYLFNNTIYFIDKTFGTLDRYIFNPDKEDDKLDEGYNLF